MSCNEGRVDCLVESSVKVKSRLLRDRVKSQESCSAAPVPVQADSESEWWEYLDSFSTALEVDHYVLS